MDAEWKVRGRVAAAAICLHASLVSAKVPNAIFGAGSAIKCRAFVNMSKDKNMESIQQLMFEWVQGWFSARNAGGEQMGAPLAVGGSISADTLQGFLVTECEDHPNWEVAFAADSLYAKLNSKGL